MPYSSLITFSVACKGMYLHTPILSHNSQTVQRNLMSQILTVCFIPTLSTFGFRCMDKANINVYRLDPFGRCTY